ncbi:MAG: class I SAM-dependent methyltransferase [Alphaproteobacteria bacterium]|nr:class I SAM-dependent methyltransferase [Alphaproteobacteria bacterium]
MFTIYCIIIAVLVFIALVELYIFVSAAEYFWCIFHNQIPYVASSKYLRRALVNEIDKHFPHATSLCDIGAGYGGLARYVAKHRKISVVALENMPFTITVARIINFITRSRVQIIKCDAFEYLKTSPRFDIGVAYLGPNVNHRLAEYVDKFNVIITFDVPIDGLKPTRIIDVGHGNTRYGFHKYPHKLFIYDFQK